MAFAAVSFQGELLSRLRATTSRDYCRFTSSGKGVGGGGVAAGSAITYFISYSLSSVIRPVHTQSSKNYMSYCIRNELLHVSSQGRSVLPLIKQATGTTLVGLTHNKIFIVQSP